MYNDGKLFVFYFFLYYVIRLYVIMFGELIIGKLKIDLKMFLVYFIYCFN